MSYVRPDDVISPKKRWRLRKVLHDGGEGGWSAAEGQWKDDGSWSPVLAIRWNGMTGTEIGNPQSRGQPTWFIIPEEMKAPLRKAISKLPKPLRRS